MDSAILSEMIETRRRLHQHPEEGWTEFETTWLVYNRLKALGCESVLTGTRLINPDCVLGRSEALVEKAANRAIAAGVPVEFIERNRRLHRRRRRYQSTGRPVPSWRCVLNMARFMCRRNDRSDIFPTSRLLFSVVPV